MFVSGHAGPRWLVGANTEASDAGKRAPALERRAGLRRLWRADQAGHRFTRRVTVNSAARSPVDTNVPGKTAMVAIAERTSVVTDADGTGISCAGLGASSSRRGENGAMKPPAAGRLGYRHAGNREAAAASCVRTEYEGNWFHRHEAARPGGRLALHFVTDPLGDPLRENAHTSSNLLGDENRCNALFCLQANTGFRIVAPFLTATSDDHDAQLSFASWPPPPPSCSPPRHGARRRSRPRHRPRANPPRAPSRRPGP